MLASFQLNNSLLDCCSLFMQLYSTTKTELLSTSSVVERSVFKRLAKQLLPASLAGLEPTAVFSSISFLIYGTLYIKSCCENSHDFVSIMRLGRYSQDYSKGLLLFQSAPFFILIMTEMPAIPRSLAAYYLMHPRRSDKAVR